MRPIEVACAAFGPVRFLGDELNTGHDFLVRANCARDELDLLLFLDSRGISAQLAGSIAERTMERLAGSRPYLLICRPLELTTWASLLNFVRLNELRPAALVTNMGFVDFTPKKKSILEDAVRQVDACVEPGTAQPSAVERYTASSGEELELFAMSYGPAYRSGIETLADSSTLVVLNTPPVEPGIPIRRHRPSSFFAGLEATNRFNRLLRGATVLDFPVFDETCTYDAVHYTDRGNELIFEALSRHL